MFDPLSVYIADDNPDVLKAIHSYIEEWAMHKDIRCTCCEIKDEGKLDAALAAQYDLVILDIKIGNINGIKFAQQIRTISASPTIAFISNFHEFAIEGYKVQAIAYLLKPIQKADLFPVLELAYKKLGDMVSPRIAIPFRNETIFLPVNDVLYVEAQKGRSKSLIVQAGKITSINLLLSSVGNYLPSPPFVRCHRSYYVNMNHITAMTANDFLELTNHQQIPVGKKYLQEFKKEIHLMFHDGV